MGSYASLHYYDEHEEIHFASIFDHKFFGYIEDDECIKLKSYLYLLEICDIPVIIANEGYIGPIALLTKEEAIKFMRLYSDDYCAYNKVEKIHDFHGWDSTIDELNDDIKLYLSFD